MKSRPLPLLLGIVLAIAGLSGASAWADNPKDHKVPAVRYEVSNDNDNTLRASVRRVERETGGQVLRAQPIQRDGREVYRVKVITPQGRVRVVEDDAGPQPEPPPPPVEREHRR